MNNVDNYSIKLKQYINYWIARVKWTSIIKPYDPNYESHDCNLIFKEQISKRLPDDVSKFGKKSLKKNVKFQSGKVISFKTDASLVDVWVMYKKHAILSTMNVTATSGLEVSVIDTDGEIVNDVISPQSSQQMLAHKIISAGRGLKVVFITLPGYAEIHRIVIRTEKDSIFKKNDDYYGRSPIVFYGSSITQGCAASRPINNYVNIIAKHTGLPTVNYGFSESANGEEEIIRYIASTKAKAFVIEYDHNATYDHLKETHNRVYQLIRSYQRKTPIIFISRMSIGLSANEAECLNRKKVIETTVKNAQKNGDDKVGFVDGSMMFDRSAIRKYFADDRHPNDKGMMILAESVLEELKKLGAI